MPIIWDEKTMGTGVATVDAQHRDLIRHLNEFMEAMKAGRSPQELRQLIRFLGQYATSHFRHEEGCMNRYRCEAAQANEKAHKQFLAVFTEIAAQIEIHGPKPSLAIRAQRELGDWVRKHIVGCDTRLRGCVAHDA